MSYYVNSQQLNLVKRIVVSGHGIFILLAFLLAILVRPYTAENNDLAGGAFLLLLSVGVLSILFSFIFFRGNKWLHLLQVPNIGIALSFFLYGHLLIAHDSL